MEKEVSKSDVDSELFRKKRGRKTGKEKLSYKGKKRFYVDYSNDEEGLRKLIEAEEWFS